MKRSGFKQKTFKEKIDAMQKADLKKKKSLSLKKNRQKSLTPKKPKKKNTKNVSSYKGTPSTKRWKASDGWKGMFWTLFSMYIRKRDFIKYGVCVSCGKAPEHWRKWDAGHYVSVSRGNADTCFDEKNVHGQCKTCNNPKWTPDSSIPYRMELLKRIGKKHVDRIEKIAKSQVASKEPTKREYQALTEKYHNKFLKL